MPVFAECLLDLTRVPDIRFAPDDPTTLLLRPVGQQALVKGAVEAMERCKGALDLDEAIRRCELIDWSGSPGSIW